MTKYVGQVHSQYLKRLSPVNKLGLLAIETQGLMNLFEAEQYKGLETKLSNDDVLLLTPMQRGSFDVDGYSKRVRQIYDSRCQVLMFTNDVTYKIGKRNFHTDDEVCFKFDLVVGMPNISFLKYTRQQILDIFVEKDTQKYVKRIQNVDYCFLTYYEICLANNLEEYKDIERTKDAVYIGYPKPQVLNSLKRMQNEGIYDKIDIVANPVKGFKRIEGFAEVLGRCKPYETIGILRQYKRTFMPSDGAKDNAWISPRIIDNYLSGIEVIWDYDPWLWRHVMEIGLDDYYSSNMLNIDKLKIYIEWKLLSEQNS